MAVRDFHTERDGGGFDFSAEVPNHITKSAVDAPDIVCVDGEHWYKWDVNLDAYRQCAAPMNIRRSAKIEA